MAIVIDAKVTYTYETDTEYQYLKSMIALQSNVISSSEDVTNKQLSILIKDTKTIS
jgi:VCBS repeat-containing protein